MDSPQAFERLAHSHTPQAIAQRIAAATQHSYLRDFVLGAIDGTVTTFAVVASVAGAELSAAVAIILGLANVMADGLSMAVGNYLSVRADRELVDHARRTEERHIHLVPEGEREEIRQIFAAKGFDGLLLDQVVEVITQDRRRWVDTMLTEELGLRLDAPRPWRAGASTFVAFVLAGQVPLVPLYLASAWKWSPQQTFQYSAIATAATFVLIGLAKGWVVRRSLWASGLETLLIGGAAAAVAYGVGVWLRTLVS